ncbi:MAG: alpha/beta fold hydrolase, partial [Acidobacteriia bacterium]|nr:alpha/beta fold hydrolase [Terriglobia bacterium]
MLRRASLSLLLAGILSAQYNSAPIAAGRIALAHLLAGRYAELADLFTPELRRQLTEDVMRMQIGPQLQSLGAFQKTGEPTSQPVDQMTVVTIPAKFANAAIDWRFTVNADGKIAGLFFQPAEQAESTEPQHAPYSRPERFREREVTIGDNWKLPGTLTVPTSTGAVAGVVLVHGSGPQDQDETIGANKPFRDLAEGLASRGIAVLRYEKRTKVYAARMAALKSLTVEQETVEDAVKATALLRAQPEISSARVFVLGHSLGGYIAPRIARQDSRLAGLILMAANARPLAELLSDQLQWMGLTGTQLTKAKADVLNALPPSYMDDLSSYNPMQEASKLALPMLVLQGERDYQVTMRDFNLWRAELTGRWNVTFRSFPALNHLFISGQGKSLPAEYTEPGHVASEVIDSITG